MNTRSSKCDQSAADSQRDLDEHNVAVHVAAPAYGVLTRRELRRLLDRLLPTIGELDAFILDFFPKVFHEFGDGSARTPRLNLLLQYAPEAELTACLQREYPQEVAAALAQRTGLSVNPRVPDTKTVTITLTLSGDVQDIAAHPLLKALANELRRLSGDPNLTLEDVKTGSILLICRCSEEGYRVLSAAFAAKSLHTLMGFAVLGVMQGVPSHSWWAKCQHWIGQHLLMSMVLITTTLLLLSLLTYLAIQLGKGRHLNGLEQNPTSSLAAHESSSFPLARLAETSPALKSVSAPTPATGLAATPPARELLPESPRPSTRLRSTTPRKPRIRTNVRITGIPSKSLQTAIKRCATKYIAVPEVGEPIIISIQPEAISGMLMVDPSDSMPRPQLNTCIKTACKLAENEALVSCSKGFTMRVDNRLGSTKRRRP